MVLELRFPSGSADRRADLTGTLGALSRGSAGGLAARRLAPLPGIVQGVIMSRRVMHHAAGGALLSVLFLAGCGHAARNVPPAVTISFCGSHPQPAPAVVEVICNTDDITARKLSWTAWGKSTAAAQGVAVVDLCAYEDCHTGSLGTVPIRLIASKIIACAGKRRAYTTLRYVFVHGSPWPGIPADMSTSGYISGANRILPPRDQTVGLTCG
jgi:hypothetical protein